MWRGVPSEGHQRLAPTRRTHGCGGHGGSWGGRRPGGPGLGVPEVRPPRPARQPAVRRLSLPGPTGLGGRSVVSTMAGPALGSDTGLALQLLQLLETENARLEAALEWRRRELVFWQWMVRRHPPPPPACPSPLHPSPPVPPLPFPSPPLPCPGHGSPGPWWVFLFSRREERSWGCPLAQP